MERIQHTNLLYAVLIILLSGLVWSCTDQDVYTIPTIENKGSAVTFSIKVPGVGIPKNSGPTTYALGVTDENAVNEVVVLLFDSDGYYTYQPTYISGNNIITNPEDSRIKTFTIEVPEGTYNMVVLANSNQSLNSVLSTISVGQPKAEVLNKLLLTNSGKWNASPGSGGYIHIPMWGEVAVTVSASMPIKTPVTLVRMVAKIDVALTTASAKSKFNLQSVRLYNYNDKGHIAPNMANWSSGEAPIATAPTVPLDATKITPPLVYDYSDGSITSDPNAAAKGVACTNEIYAFEAAAGDASSLANNTCLVVGGYFSDDNELTYYRIDFTNTSDATTYLPLLRNHRYEINITDVKAKGFSSADKAFNASSGNIETNIKIWDDAQITHIMFDEHYILGVSQDEFIFTSEARVATSSDNKLAITTDAPDGWKVEKVVDVNGNDINPTTGWLKLTPNVGATGTTTSTQIIVKENNTSNHRKGFIHLKAGKLTYIISVEQKEAPLPEANSYIVAPNGAALKIPVSRANQSLLLGTQLNENEAFTAELVWTDNVNKISPDSNIKYIGEEGDGPTGYLVVEPGTAEGNAVVAIKNSVGKILWSWHIWVTNDTPTAIGNFMDRNLGAIGNTPGAVATKGLLYQWGRKDPFPGSSTVDGTDEPQLYNVAGFTEVAKIGRPSNSNFSNSVANPATFYTNNTDWYGNTRNNYLWNSSTGTKTVYDPCPSGWRVPRSNLLVRLEGDYRFASYGVTNNNNGGFYPATGRRSSRNGSFANVGTRGFYWSCTVHNNDVEIAFIEKDGPEGKMEIEEYSRSYGFSVRCVKE